MAVSFHPSSFSPRAAAVMLLGHMARLGYNVKEENALEQVIKTLTDAKEGRGEEEQGALDNSIEVLKAKRWELVEARNHLTGYIETARCWFALRAHIGVYDYHDAMREFTDLIRERP